MEEFEREISLGDPFAVFTYENQIKGSHTIEVVYYAKFRDPSTGVTIHPEDHSGYDWLSEEEVIARKADLVPAEHVAHEHDEDPEYLAIIRGFELLRGERLNFGYETN